MDCPDHCVTERPKQKPCPVPHQARLPLAMGLSSVKTGCFRVNTLLVNTKSCTSATGILQRGPGHIRVHTAKGMWPYAAQATSRCGLGDGISMRPGCFHTRTSLSTCDGIAPDARWRRVRPGWKKRGDVQRVLLFPLIPSPVGLDVGATASVGMGICLRNTCTMKSSIYTFQISHL